MTESNEKNLKEVKESRSKELQNNNLRFIELKSNELKSNNLSYQDFNIESKLGKGAFGTVWLATKKAEKRQYALKIMYPKPEFEESFKLSLTLKYPTLMNCYSVFFEKLNFQGKTSAMRMITVLEYIDGVSLFHAVNGIKDTNNSLVLENIKRKELSYYLPDIANGLKYIHTHKMIHRDIKPDNILITKDNKVKIIDYDFLTEMKPTLRRKIGTPYYLAPEIYEGRYYDEKVDLWALGVTIYYCLTTEFPFNGEDEAELMQDVISSPIDYLKVPQKYLQMTQGLLQKDPNKRINLTEVVTLIS